MTASIDPSLRFVMSEDAPLVRNLAALWAIEPKLAREIEALDSWDDAYQIEPSKSGAPTVKRHTSDQRTVYLHSRYQPLEDANRLIESFETAETVAFYVQGFGLGYH